LTSLSGLQEVAVAKEIANNRFTIQSQRPRSKISWQVTGIRHDRYANAHRTQVIVPKAKADQGKYLYPQLYGKPRREGIGFQRPGR
jgi:trimeric autotransporter adhesin